MQQFGFSKIQTYFSLSALGPYQVCLTGGTVFHKTRTALRKKFWVILLMGRQKSGICMLSAQRMLKIKNYKTVWGIGDRIRAVYGIGDEIRQAVAHRDAASPLAGLIDMDDTHLGRVHRNGLHPFGSIAQWKLESSFFLVPKIDIDLSILLFWPL